MPHLIRRSVYIALPILFLAGVSVAFALGRGDGVEAITTSGGPIPGKQALTLGRAACLDLRHRVGAARFTKTFRTVSGCRAIMSATAQSGIVLCRKRYPVGSTAELYCIQLAIAGSPPERAAVAGLRITTRKTATVIPIPTSGPGAGTGVGTGAGTGGGVPGSHR